MKTFLDITYAIGCVALLYWLLFGFANRNDKKSDGK